MPTNKSPPNLTTNILQRFMDGRERRTVGFHQSEDPRQIANENLGEGGRAPKMKHPNC